MLFSGGTEACQLCSVNVFICCLAQSCNFFSNMFVVWRDAGQNDTIPTSVSKGTRSVLKLFVFYIINKMVKLRSITRVTDS